MNRLLILIGCLALIPLQLTANDQEEAKRLFEIATRKLSLMNIHLIMELETHDGKGNHKEKTLDVKFAKFGDEKRVMIEINAPKEMSGTKILTTDYPDRQGIIEIYMPSTGRIQRLKANKRNFKILDSEIPLGWISSGAESGIDYTLLGREPCNQTECYKIKLQQSNQKDYEVAFISTIDERLMQIEMYSSNDKLIARTQLWDYLEMKGSDHKVYPQNIKAENLKTGQYSNMVVHQVNYLNQVKEEDFTIKNPKQTQDITN